ncbi:nucleotidyltransferase [Aquimarina sp. 2201CG1-2-11]|uniref:nucleotidyltransferase domain-containing protein n=1 Tax=Aquimarina discodermiae TaxID=3231043 RepID=UPI003462C276
MRIEHKDLLNKILEFLGGELDITKTQFESAVKSYQAVAEQLTKDNSALLPYKPKILPQGSFMLGTMVKPVVEGSKLDVDLVCQLINKNASWTQYDLKQKVGNQIKDNKTYEKMIKKPEGRRCWTLVYAEDSNYHMDILPCIVDSNYNVVFEKSFTNTELKDADELAIRITDKEDFGYNFTTNHHDWLKSNPFGYAKWFFRRAIINSTRSISLKAAIEPIRDFDKEKFPLQRVVQILKRHRDIMFSEDSEYNLDHKPISIIITTLAAKSYDKEDNILDALVNAVGNMRGEIKEKYNSKTGKIEKFIENPVNSEENFADKWIDEDKKRKYFYEWLDKLEEDIASIISSDGIGLNNLQKSMSSQFGNSVTEKAFVNYGNQSRILTETGKRKMEAGTGLLGATVSGPIIKKHDFEGLNG